MTIRLQLGRIADLHIGDNKLTAPEAWEVDPNYAKLADQSSLDTNSEEA